MFVLILTELYIWAKKKPKKEIGLMDNGKAMLIQTMEQNAGQQEWE